MARVSERRAYIGGMRRHMPRMKPRALPFEKVRRTEQLKSAFKKEVGRSLSPAQ